MPARPARPALYSSPIQHVLVLQEENGELPDEHPHSRPPARRPDHRPWNDGLAENAASVRADEPKREHVLYPWRIRDRMKTAHGALVLCLNIGVDPPDVAKPSPCARLQCWNEPNIENASKSLQHIANALKTQYEFWQPKARYKVAPDPTVPELKRVCINLRRAAKDERVLFHYNGHGVPKPTNKGEIWVFNYNYTQYIPFNLYDLQEVLGSPSLYIFDCNSAGTIFDQFAKNAEQYEREWSEACKKADEPLPPPAHRNSVLLAACTDNELLPTSPSMPADLFTSCLTTPIKTAFRWFAKRTLVRGITLDMLDRIPGNLNARQTPLGEINWIFTAITDTIAWNVLPRDKFKKLYRQDLLLASLMRNFLLADRIMRSFGCHPVSQPALPETHTHPLWHSFDLAIEQLLAQLPTMIAEEEARMRVEEDEAELRSHSTHHVRFAINTEEALQSAASYGARAIQQSVGPGYQSYEADPRQSYRYRHASFFEDQMKAFDVWLDMGPDQRNPPEQLPIMLQVLLSPSFRIKALPMLSRYLQTGPVAVDHALSVGIFPYVLRLLQSQSVEIRQNLVFIWSKILALDDTCRSDLVKEKGEEYFVRFLTPGRTDYEDPEPVYLAVAMFVLSVIAKDYADRCRAVGTLEACYSRLVHESSFVRRWSCLCLTEVIRQASPPTQVQALAWADLVHTLRRGATDDQASDARAAAVSTLSAIMNGVLKGLSRASFSSHRMRHEYHQSMSGRDSDNNGGREDMAARSPLRAPSILSNGLPPVGPDNLRVTADQLLQDDADFLDAPVPPFLPDERDALLQIGKVIAEVGRRESSVLVRREVAIAIAQAVRFQEERFVRAAYATDVLGIDEDEDFFARTDVDQCEAVYRRLWTSLSELAYDPHPVVAALARRRYDLVSEKIELSDYKRPAAREDISPTDHMLSPPEHYADQDFLHDSTTGRMRSEMLNGSPSTSIVQSEAVQEWSKAQTEAASVSRTPLKSVRGSETTSKQLSGNKVSSPPGFTTAHESTPPAGGPASAKPGSVMVQRLRKKLGVFDVPKSQIGTGSIHVRSTSGSFDLNVPSRLPHISRIPCVNSASLIPVAKNANAQNGAPVARRNQGLMTTTESFEGEAERSSEEGPRSLTQIALAKGVENLVKTFSQQFNLGALTGSPGKSRSGSSNDSRDAKDDRGFKPKSPPRPPKRSLSYQVLNAATSLSPDGEAPLFTMSRNTSYFESAGVGVTDEGSAKGNKNLPHGYDRLYLSGVGHAALSLYEWSSAYISRVEFDATTTDYTQEAEAIPRYAALWHKFTKSSGDIPVEDSLRAFARLGEGDSLMRIGPTVDADDDGKEFKSAKELSVYAMGAGGGAVTAMAFLPRDSGMGDDQLLATGDSTGSVGVYDIRTGNCQGSFGVPSPPGIPEVGISSVLCLNPPVSTAKASSDTVPNSRSALILAGAYDGRVAVFKSDIQGRTYRIISTFQASGPSFWSMAGTRREATRASGSTPLVPGGQSSTQSNNLSWSGPSSFPQAVRESGNGLVLAFDSDSSYLAAGGCDTEFVRVWDLSREQCIWEAETVREGTWPTALAMWNRVNPKVFVVGSSDGAVNVVDMRERREKRNGRQFWRLGSSKEPIISVGTCSPGRYRAGESVVAADIGGEIAFWDPRWDGKQSLPPSLEMKPEDSRIKAHSSNVAAMAVHPSGRYIASGSTCGSTGKCVKVFGPDRGMVKMITHYETPSGGLFQQNNRISPVTSLTFQHETSLLAIGCLDSSVIIYGRPEHFSGI